LAVGAERERQVLGRLPKISPEQPPERRARHDEPLAVRRQSEFLGSPPLIRRQRGGPGVRLMTVKAKKPEVNVRPARRRIGKRGLVNHGR
jgi:hypothetical protein